VPKSGDRSDHFPAIEKRYGQPMSYWFGVMKEIKGRKYAEQMAYLQENHGFSRAHANALVLYSRGSITSKRFTSVEDFLAQHDEVKQKTIRTTLKAVQAKFPKAEIVMAWNQPMVKYRGKYIFGVSVATHHILIAPFNSEVISEFRPRLGDYKVNKKTIQVPVDWNVDRKLVQDLAAASYAAVAEA
jgi:uncharacterized protein YdhG (YjbR/CyaY superfamily)